MTDPVLVTSGYAVNTTVNGLDLVYSTQTIDFNLAPVWVECSYVNANGEPMTGTVTFYPGPKFVADADTNTIVVQTPVIATLDANGYFGIQLISSNDVHINPTGWTYTVTENLIDAENNEYTNTYSIDASANTYIHLAEVAPVADYTGTPVVRGAPGFSMQIVDLP